MGFFAKVLVVIAVAVPAPVLVAPSARATGHQQDVTVDPDGTPGNSDDVTFHFEAPQDTPQARTDVASAVTEFNALKNTARMKQLANQGSTIGGRTINVVVLRDAPGTALGVSEAGGLMQIDMGDWDRIKAAPDVHLSEGTATDRATVANNLMKDVIAHEMAHLGNPDLPHDDEAGKDGVITISNEVLQQAGVAIRRAQDKDCPPGSSAGFTNGVRLRSSANPGAAGGWNRYLDGCHRAPAVPASSTLTLGLFAAVVLLAARSTRHRLGWGSRPG